MTHKTLTVAAAMLLCLAVAGKLSAATSVTYMVSGTFAAPPLSGADILKLAGNPFSIYVVAAEDTKPSKTGPGYAQYTDLRLYGTFVSGLLSTLVQLGCPPGVTPPACVPQTANLVLEIGNKKDEMRISATVQVVGVPIHAVGTIPLPLGTFTSLKIGPFTTPVAIGSPGAVLKYSDTTASTTLSAIGAIVTTSSSTSTALTRP